MFVSNPQISDNVLSGKITRFWKGELSRKFSFTTAFSKSGGVGDSLGLSNNKLSFRGRNNIKSLLYVVFMLKMVNLKLDIKEHLQFFRPPLHEPSWHE